MMRMSSAWQLEGDGAKAYAEVLVPTIMGPAARRLVEWAPLGDARVVVDLGSGPGVATAAAVEHLAGDGRVIAVDCNPAMVAIGRDLLGGDPRVGWLVADAAHLPLAAGSADAVVAAHVLQHVLDRAAVLAEIRRVLTPGGAVLVSTWAPLDANPYFRALLMAVEEHLGPGTAVGLGASFTMTDLVGLTDLLADHGFEVVAAAAPELQLELPALADLVPRHLAASTVAASVSAASPTARAAVVTAVTRALGDLPAGAQLPFRMQLVRAVRPAG